jgi:hypothetical protein
VPVEQGKSEPFLELLDLMADCGMGNTQFIRCVGETGMPGGSFKTAQGVQRWKTLHAFPLLQFFSHRM